MSDAAQPLDGDPAARVVVAGASGFTGALAAQIVWAHPALELARVTARSEVGTPLDRLYPRYRVPLVLEELNPDAARDCDAAIVAYPHGASAPAVAALRERGLRVVDLSADFRFRDPGTYRRWYGDPPDPRLAAEAVYGLTELYRRGIASANLVANPGCYPTAAVLALAPLAEAGAVEDVVVDAKSGVSGAGRGGGERLHFVSVDENFAPYGTEGHRHEPEIAQELSALGSDSPLTFVPHLLPLDQGELVSCYVRLSRGLGAAELERMYWERYGEEPFVELTDGPPGVRDVRDTNSCRIHVTVDDDAGRAVVFAAIDNLWKGAAGQAVQNLNLMLGLPETAGLR
ncbi:MAG TPA: N-acetyl-gamma-glutamyl-phosphate reductase [Solirubrobacterales bacterium]|nr:N-acetyl-gamma-glutamyl-phosphate reductase [Solirubrobacterales bacterium]